MLNRTLTLKRTIALFLLLASVQMFGAKVNQASFGDGQVLLDVNTTGSKVDTFQVTNNNPTKSAQFLVFNAAVLNGQPVGTVVVWQFTQPPASTSALVPIPTVDNNGNAIAWTIGQIPLKGGGTVTGLVSPAWSFSLIQP